MAYQSEQQLEDNLLKQLSMQGFDIVALKDNAALEANLKSQLERVNHCVLSESEFRQVLGKLEKGNIFTKAKTLRDRIAITLDNGDAMHLTLLFDKPQNNRFQIAQQITVKGTLYLHQRQLEIDPQQPLLVWADCSSLEQQREPFSLQFFPAYRADNAGHQW